MTSTRIKFLTLVGGITCSLFFAAAVQAQPNGDEAASMTGSQATGKQAQKAQKKAERKARRAQKNADLNKLEKNGYNPSGNQLRYPQNVQNAEKKANPQGPGATNPASAP